MSIIHEKTSHVYLNSVQQMVSGASAGEGLQTGFSRHGLPPQRAPLDTVYPLREHLNSVQRMVSGGYCEGLFPDTVCWTRLRNTWTSRRQLFAACSKNHSRLPVVQMALQTEKIYFRINYAFHSRYRYRRKFFWNSFSVADTDTAVLCSFEGAASR